MHLIDKHMYPKNYFFAVTKEGVDGRNSLLLEGGHHRRRSSASQPGGYNTASRRQSLRQPEAVDAGHGVQRPGSERKPGDTPGAGPDPLEETVDSDMAGLTSAMSSLQFVPTSVRFGRGKAKAGFSRR